MIRLDTLRTFMTGALRIWEEDGYFRFSRFTEKQEACLDSRGFSFFSMFRTANAGMRLEFLTCGGTMSFDYKAIACHENNAFGFEISIDGVPLYHLYDTVTPDVRAFQYEIPDTSKPSRVTLYFPYLADLWLRNIVIPEDSMPVSKKCKLLMLGDSITQGFWAQHMNQTYSNILADMLDAQMLNQGIGGDTFWADNLDPELPFDPDIVTVAYGVNDWAAGVLWSGSVEAYLEKLDSLYRDKKVFVLLPTWYLCGSEPKEDGHTLQDGREHIRACAEKYPYMKVIDCSGFVPHLPDYYGDDVHPSDMGFLYYGYHLTKEIEAHLQTV